MDGHINANTNAFTRAQGSSHKPYRSYKNNGSHSCTQIIKSHTRTAMPFVPLSKVWLHIVTTVSLLRICPGTQTLVCSIILVYWSLDFFHLTEAKPLHRCVAASLIPPFLSDLPFSPSIVFFSPLEGKVGYICFVSRLPFLSSSITCPPFPNLLLHSLKICINGTASCFMSHCVSIILLFSLFPHLCPFASSAYKHLFWSQSRGQSHATNHRLIWRMYLNAPSVTGPGLNTKFLPKSIPFSQEK